MTEVRFTYPGDDEPSQVLDYRSELARRQVEIMSIKFDLDFAIASLESLISRHKTEPRESVIERALWNAAVVMYFRCFDKGAREFFLKHEDVPDDYADHHRYIRHLRNKFIAHSENGYEDNRVGIVFQSGEDGSINVRGTAPTQRRHTEDLDIIERTLQLVESIASQIKSEFDLQSRAVAAEVQTLSAEELSELNIVVFEDVDSSTVGQRRKWKDDLPDGDQK